MDHIDCPETAEGVTRDEGVRDWAVCETGRYIGTCRPVKWDMRSRKVRETAHRSGSGCPGRWDMDMEGSKVSEIVRYTGTCRPVSWGMRGRKVSEIAHYIGTCSPVE